MYISRGLGGKYVGQGNETSLRTATGCPITAINEIWQGLVSDGGYRLVREELVR